MKPRVGRKQGHAAAGAPRSLMPTVTAMSLCAEILCRRQVLGPSVKVQQAGGHDVQLVSVGPRGHGSKGGGRQGQRWRQGRVRKRHRATAWRSAVANHPRQGASTAPAAAQQARTCGRSGPWASPACLGVGQTAARSPLPALRPAPAPGGLHVGAGSRVRGRSCCRRWAAPLPPPSPPAPDRVSLAQVGSSGSTPTHAPGICSSCSVRLALALAPRCTSCIVASMGLR